MHGEGGVEEKFLATELECFDPGPAPAGQRLQRALVDGAALVARVQRRARVDKGVQAHARQQPGLAGGNGAVQVGDDALRQVVGLARFGQRQRRQPRRRTPMPAAHGARHAGVAKVVHAAPAAVALAGRIHQRQLARQRGGEKTGFQRRGHGLGVAGADEAAAGHRPAALHQPCGLLGVDDLHSPRSGAVCDRAVGALGRTP